MKLSTFLCDKNLNIKCVISDKLTILDRFESKNIKEIFKNIPNDKLNLIVEMAEAKQAILNWKLLSPFSDQSEVLYFSMIFWGDRILIRISKEIISSFFYDVNGRSLTTLQPDFITDNSDNSDLLNKYTQLNNEITAIQRELQKKNLDLEETNRKLKELATTDSMTGLFNRREIMERATEELERAKREKRYFGLAEIDMDNLKEINDTYGHHMGDVALKKIAATLASSTRGYDAAGRIGGDEFLIFFSLEEKGQLQIILDRLLNKMQHLTLTEEKGFEFEPRASIGAVCFSAPKHQEITIDDLLIKADQALYQSKRAGGNQITLFLECSNMQK
ncbi:GGDEF domain-containing protein [bacterium]|nr:GGDEF domain-containing protein [bacterium]